MSIVERSEVRDLLIAARATRNYCMLTGRGSENSDKLIDALSPFEGNPNQIKPIHLVSLRKAMRDVCVHIDDYTLTRILDGDPPVRIGPKQRKNNKTNGEGESITAWMVGYDSVVNFVRTSWPLAWQRIVLPGIAILLLVLAMHYTHWSFNASLTVNRLDDHMATDVHEKVRDLIVVARAIEENKEKSSALSTSTPAQKLFNEAMSELKAYHYQEESLRRESIISALNFDAFVAGREFITAIPTRLFTPPPSRPPQSATQENELANAPKSDHILSGQKFTNTVSAASDMSDTVREIERETTEQISSELRAAASNDGQRTTENFGLVQFALAGHQGFEKIVKVIAEKTGRNSNSNPADHIVTRLELLQTAKELKGKISIANRFVLPMIYGALGAALFCLVRVLTPSLSDLGPARAFLRVLFGAFAAMTLSMLFIPANVFSLNEQTNPTLIFLACFLFGYSFDAVLTALHRMEAFLRGRLQQQEGV